MQLAQGHINMVFERDTAKYQHKFIGKTIIFRTHGLGFEVKIENVRTIYGKMQFLVIPIKGEGMTWIDAPGTVD